MRGILLIGEASPIIRKELEKAAPIYSCGDLKTAVRKARAEARSGEVVLLSPACASFDQFLNFEDRGSKYKKFVLNLK